MNESTSIYKFLEVRSVLPNKADAIIVLAGAKNDRLPAAAQLYLAGYAQKIILTNDGVFSSWSTKYNRNLYQIEWAEEYLVNIGIPREGIVKLPFYGSATMLDVLAVKKFILKNDLKKIIVVTSDYHTRRTFWAFRHAFKGYAIDFSLFPVKSHDIGIKGIVVEYVKFFYYVLKYGLLDIVPDMNEITLTEK